MKSAFNSIDKREVNIAMPTITIPLILLCLTLLFSGHAHALEKLNEHARGPSEFEIFDPNKFDRSTTIDNKLLPMQSGTRWVYEGTTVEDDGEVVPHRIEINITDLIKVISGVRTVISYGIGYTDGELEEAELDFYAQDNNGNVWHFGKYLEKYDDGKIVNTPTWIDGIEDARAGIAMQAEPRLGTPSYAQGWGPSVRWTDRAKIYRMGQKTSVLAGSYEDVLVIAETSDTEIDAPQLKYYVPGVGNVRVGWTGKGKYTKKTLELVKIEHLDPDALAEIRTKALKLERSAYKNSKNVYARTPTSVIVPIESIMKFHREDSERLSPPADTSREQASFRSYAVSKGGTSDTRR